MGTAIVSAVAVVLVAIIEALAARDRKEVKKQQDKAEKRSERRAEESRLSMKLMDANLQLSIVTANALTGGHNNGNVERARQAAQDAQDAYNEFLQQIASEQIAKV